MAKDKSDILGISRLDGKTPEGSRQETNETINPDPPATPTEIKLAGIWSSVLPQGQIQRADNFIALGGDSLALAQVIAEVDEIYHISITLETIANNLTLMGIAKAIDRLASAEGNRQ